MRENELKALRLAADGGIHYDRARYRDKDGRAATIGGGWQTIYRLHQERLIASLGRTFTAGPWHITELGRKRLGEVADA